MSEELERLEDFKREILNRISHASAEGNVYSQEAFFEYVTDMLAESGILDNVEYSPYRNTRKGIRIDGYSWNELEGTICGIVVDFSNEQEIGDKLTNTDIKKIGNRVRNFFDNVRVKDFLDSLEVTDPGGIAAERICQVLNAATKIRIVLLTDRELSTRVKKIGIESIAELDTSLEIYDLERLRNLEQSESEYEEFTVDLAEISGGQAGIRALPANVSGHEAETYLAIMPAKLLSSIYHEFGQRLLESNVRTFLDFRAATNKGMRKTLVAEPENFFAYNNGLTVTATRIATEMNDGQLTITALDNMQIVNGGQTTAAIYFSPREKGGIKGKDKTHNYSDIELEKVFVQMKLTVVGDKEQSEEMKANIATFANSQNSIQQADLVSNHPFHRNLETRSRKQLMPAGENGLSSKWFYERARGQYATKLRAQKGKEKNRFEKEFPKRQVFTKTDMAKYENTWRMNPHIVKKGAQANLKILGAEIIKEFEQDEEAFGPEFYNDLVAKMILFRAVDSSIAQTDWYKADRGLKAEIVTYGIALLRFKLRKSGLEINLKRIYKRQSVSASMLNTVHEIARELRENIRDVGFTGGVANPSEFCKSEKGWKRIQSMNVDLRGLSNTDYLTPTGLAALAEDKAQSKKVGKSLSEMEYVFKVSDTEWNAISEFYSEKGFPSSHKNVSVPDLAGKMQAGGPPLSEYNFKFAKEIREKAIADGFQFIS